MKVLYMNTNHTIHLVSSHKSHPILWVCDTFETNVVRNFFSEKIKWIIDRRDSFLNMCLLYNALVLLSQSLASNNVLSLETCSFFTLFKKIQSYAPHTLQSLIKYNTCINLVILVAQFQYYNVVDKSESNVSSQLLMSLSVHKRQLGKSSACYYWQYQKTPDQARQVHFLPLLIIEQRIHHG